MSFEFCSFSSGSSGNSYMVKSDNTTLLIDVGISGKKIFEGLDKAGLSPLDVDGILITHEHSDHIKSLRIVSKKSENAMVYSSLGTWNHIGELVQQHKQVTFQSGDEFAIGDIKVKSFSTSHDAEDPVGYSFCFDNKQISIVTDTGIVSEAVFNEIKKADLLALEANHDVNVVQFCKYPYNIKRRILGEYGHLSNETAAKCLCRALKESSKKRKVLLSHLSRENNSPEMARITFENILEEEKITIDERLEIEVIRRDVVSPLYKV